jgi:hypothetical protein
MVLAGKVDADDVEAKEFFALQRKFHLQKARAEVEALSPVPSTDTTPSTGGNSAPGNENKDVNNNNNKEQQQQQQHPGRRRRRGLYQPSVNLLPFTSLFSSSVPIPNMSDEFLLQRRVGVSPFELGVPRYNSAGDVLGGGAELERGTVLPRKREGIDFRSVSRRFRRFVHARLVVVAARFYYHIVHKNACLHDVRHLVALSQATRLLENVPTSDTSFKRPLNVLPYGFLSACITLVLGRNAVSNRLDEESQAGHIRSARK